MVEEDVHKNHCFRWDYNQPPTQWVPRPLSLGVEDDHSCLLPNTSSCRGA